MDNSVSAFGVEHFSKAEKGYRDSYLSRFNPRSKTEVKEGTMPQRVLLPAAGGFGGHMVGRAIGGKIASRGLAGTAGAIGGATWALDRNIKSGDTVSRHKKTGKKARTKVGWADASMNIYSDPVKKSFKSGVATAKLSRKAARLAASERALGLTPDKRLTLISGSLTKGKKRRSLATRIGEKVGTRVGDSAGSFLNPW